jgi:hypothetical protein
VHRGDVSPFEPLAKVALQRDRSCGQAMISHLLFGHGWQSSNGVGKFQFLLKRSSSLETNLGVWAFMICWMPGPNSWKTFIPASPPTVEPK